MPDSCALMDAKSGKSFLVSGVGSGIARQVEVESGSDLGQKKSHTLIVIKSFSDERIDPNSPNTWVMDA